MIPPRREAQPSPLLELLHADRNAITAYVALRLLAGGSRQVNTTRARITEVCGLHRNRITTAITALHEGGWIIRRRGHAPNRRWYRITFKSEGLFPWAAKTYPRARKNTRSPRAVKSDPSAASKVRENVPKRAKRLSRENGPNSLEGVGASYSPAPAPTGGAERTPTQGAFQHQETTDSDGGGPTRPITEILGLGNG